MKVLGNVILVSVLMVGGSLCAQTARKPVVKRHVAPKVEYISHYMREMGLLYLRLVRDRSDAAKLDSNALDDDSLYNKALVDLKDEIKINMDHSSLGDIDFSSMLESVDHSSRMLSYAIASARINSERRVYEPGLKVKPIDFTYLKSSIVCQDQAKENIESGVFEAGDCSKELDAIQEANIDPVQVPVNSASARSVPGSVSISAGVLVGLLLEKTAPLYPPIAKAARVSGTVTLQGTISKTGLIEELHVVSGPAMLWQAALDAVKTWRYRPYIIDGKPVEVESTVNVVFTLGG